MEIDITRTFEDDTWAVSGSIATHGPNAARQTWEAARDYARRNALLVEPAEIQALKDHVQGIGFGEDVQAYSDADCNALFAQLIAGDKREAGLDNVEMDDAEAWAEYEADAEAGRVRGHIFRGDDGRVYYYLGD